MNKLNFLKQSGLDRLQANISANEKHYLENAPWLQSYLAGSSWFQESTIVEGQAIKLRIPTSKKDYFDLENTRAVYTALRHLTPVQASDARLWGYLTHVTCWEYMRKRWPAEQYIEDKNFRDNIQSRYLFMADRSRALIRNGMSRLWWYGYCSYDESRDDPFELTGILLKNLDVTQTILERAFSRSAKVTKAVLGVLQEREANGNPFYVRDKVREVGKYLVQVGGVVIVDALDESDLKKLVSAKVEQLSAV